MEQPPTEPQGTGSSEPAQPAEAPQPPDLAPAAPPPPPAAPPATGWPAPQAGGAPPPAQGGPPGAPPPWQMPTEAPGPAPGLDFGPAGERLVAYIVDNLIIVGISIVCFLLFWLIIPIFIAIAVWFVYFPWFWKRNAQTPGMRMFNLYVVRDRDGGPISWGQAILRFIGYFIDGLVFYLGFAWVLIDGRKRGWHDLIAGTLVVKPMQGTR